jgi:hypothetical protein
VALRTLLGRERTYFQAQRDVLPTSFDTACLIDPTVLCGTPQAGSSLVEDMFRWKIPGKPRAIVAFGTEYGFSKEVAIALCDALYEAGAVSPRLVDLAHYEVRSNVVYTEFS